MRNLTLRVASRSIVYAGCYSRQCTGFVGTSPGLLRIKECFRATPGTTAVAVRGNHSAAEDRRKAYIYASDATLALPEYTSEHVQFANDQITSRVNLIRAAATGKDIPKTESFVEVALAGRSNVGKSSLLNALVERPNLATTSSTPGCTQSINFYRAGHGLVMVDLPGYGYARESRRRADDWNQLTLAYITERANWC